ncbi:BMP family ABC transporter substrate-binding protein [Cryobacterium frigoriphilum]|uniref:BMP family ABC transporter substrate-binding protein n=1 Tax=Cryobacterium frigoriphilum TaxID=1259150 RepID=A0A4R9ABV7_9MICO|nr:BMP family ABC transporter substrate-binding protein [Cryobacterium frigoriphilum]TFD56126.1 BMP family ABC transporter substrate-binding protein [Cryobacterium frigoriphilum]
MRPRPHVSTVVAAAVAVAMFALVTGCTTPTDTSGSVGTSGSSLRPLGSGFLGGITLPTSEATLTPQPGSWHGVVPPADFSAVVIYTGDDNATRQIGVAVERWASEHDVELRVMEAADDDEVERHLNTAVELAPDLVLGAGSGVVDVFSLLTAQNLGQEFLMIGAQLPEPTENVTAAVWEGATFRGTGISAAADQTASAVTVDRAEDAVNAGVASVLHDLTGIVLRLTF